MSGSSCKSCVNNPYHFCYICGKYCQEKQRRNINDFVKQAYQAYFGKHLGQQDKCWVPHKVCKTCVESLRYWTQGGRKGLPFGIPMTWREPRNHFDDCYFCAVNVEGMNRYKKRSWIYPDVQQSAKPPTLHSKDLPTPQFTSLPGDCYDDVEMLDVSSSSEHSSESEFEESSPTRKGFSQSELNDLIRDLNLSKKSAELLASRLKEKHCLHPGVSITSYRTRERDILPYFTNLNDIVYCNDISGLLNLMGPPEYQPQDWRLFIDSSKRSLKCVLLHNRNVLASIPIGHSTILKEEYKNIKLVLEKISYDQHQWQVCVDLKMVNFLLGQQSGYTKYPCFLCLWDSRAKNEHWTRKVWPSRLNMDVGKANIIEEPLISREKVILPPLHIKLGLMKQFVKALDKNGDCFKYICELFPGLSIEKLKAGIFDGPKIRSLIKNQDFKNHMNQVESQAWSSFVLVVENFLGNHKAETHYELVDNMLKKFQKLGVNMSVKLHYLHSHLDKFPDNLGDYSEEQGERFHQDIKIMEERYKGRWDHHMMADYCWNLQRDCLNQKHNRKSHRKRFS
ncbi:uncharacterized protein [Onthophagus taurus]|uniref:uncharacterized protein n=1 Tax=Onthophagus taurus TaxID=166361 RepID=UPI0039BECCB4